MSIRWDALLARHLARELDALLSGERVRAVRFDGASRDLVVLMREHALLWRLHPTRGHVVLLPPIEPAQGDLRVRARIVGVDAPSDERIVRFALAPTGSDRRPTWLVVELLGNQWNAALTEDVDGGNAPPTVRHVLWRSEAGRAPRVGHPYLPPPPLARRGVDGDVSVEEWKEVLGPLPPDARRRALLRAFAWTSSLNAPALLPDDDLSEGHARWARLADPGAGADPVVVETEAGPQPYPFPLPGTESRAAESLLAALRACLPAEADEAAQVASAAAPIGPTLLRRLEGAARRAARRQERLESELSGLEEPEALRRIGDVILARYREIPTGAATARLAGFDGETYEVDLDPAEPPHANAARYYDRAAKTERARERLPGLVEQARAERGDLEALLVRARAGEAEESEIREVLGPDEPTERGQVVGPALPYRSYRSSGGLEIRVGRGARHNDDLTFRHSAPGDVWLHARDNAGAHVVLRWRGPGNPPPRDLTEAATLAALNSKSRTSGTAPVDWTLRKYVRKPRKAPPGQVLADRVQTVFVEPDSTLPDRLERLR